MSMERRHDYQPSGSDDYKQRRQVESVPQQPQKPMRTPSETKTDQTTSRGNRCLAETTSRRHGSSTLPLCRPLFCSLAVVVSLFDQLGPALGLVLPLESHWIELGGAHAGGRIAREHLLECAEEDAETSHGALVSRRPKVIEVERLVEACWRC